MKHHLLLCRARDREVRVMITGTLLQDDQAPVRDEGLVCLDIGEGCIESLCPLGGSTPDAMVGRLVRSGVPLDALATVVAECPACGQEAEMVLYGHRRAACGQCGAAARWAFDHAEPD
jgi:ribosomal protein S27AE